ncbi:MAG: IPT/TIG domain-containing protein [Thermoanaerobaculia bacterium]
MIDRLANLAPAARTLVEGVVLETGREVDFDLESFEVWAPGARIIEHGKDGLRRVPVPRDRYYRGSVSGDSGSFVFLSVGRTLRGVVVVSDGVFAIAPSDGAYGAEVRSTAPRAIRIDHERQRPEGRPEFSCKEVALESPHSRVSRSAALQEPAPLFTSTTYVAPIAVETDYELFQRLGSTSALTAYVGDLVAASSAIYSRDIQVQKTLSVLHLYSTPSDPWTQTNTELALYELGDYWHANYLEVPRSTVHLLSAKAGGGGIAWRGAICDADFLCGISNCGSALANGHYGGGYGVSSSLSGIFSVSNPSFYWDLLCFSHEIGHNFNSRHTHCYDPPVDQCCPCEPSQASDCTGPVPPEKGTIMSYCHLRPGSYDNIKLFLAVPAESSVAVYGVMRTYVESAAASCLGTVSVPTPSIGSVAPASGPSAGGTSVVISGSNFQSGAAVAFGGVPATGVNVASANSITATTPPHAAGAVAVSIQNPGGIAGSLPNGFTYIDSLTLLGVSPKSGPAGGGTAITLTGTGFLAGAGVTVRGVAAGSVVVASSGTITANTPAGAIGPADVVVTNPGGATATLPGGFVYTATGGATRLYTITPCRLVDTRNPTGPFGGPALAAGAVRSFTVPSGSCAVPADAAAVSLNITVADPTTPGTLTFFPGSGTVPGTNTISFVPGKNRANNVTMGVVGGVLSVRDFQASGTVNLIIDVNGYYR